MRANGWGGAALGVVLAGATGCETLLQGQGQRLDQLQEQTANENLQRDVAQLKDAVRDLRAAQERSFAELEQLRAESRGGGRTAETRLAELERGLRAEVSARESLRRDIDAIPGKVAGIVNTHRPPAPAPQVIEGREHTVEAGQTISDIAKAYGVKTTVIIKANNITRPDALKVGQKLIIPE